MVVIFKGGVHAYPGGASCGSRGGDRLHFRLPRSGLSLLLVHVLTPRRFSPGTPVFLSLQKPTFPNSSSIKGVFQISPLR